MSYVRGIMIFIWESGVSIVGWGVLHIVFRRLRSIPGVIVFAILSVSPAFCEPLDSAKSIELSLHGRVGEQCAIGQIGTMAFGDITHPGLTAATRVQFLCNVPFDMKIQAAHGGLANLQYPQGQGPYSGTLPFTMTVAIPVRKPSPSLIGRNFSSRDLLGGSTLSSGDGIAVEGFALSITLGLPSREAGLLAGQYSEILTITVSPS